MNRLKQVLMRVVRDFGIVLPIVAGILIIYFFIRLKFKTLCPFRGIFGFVCPGCGMTHAIMNLLHGNFQRAFYWNPAVFPLTLFLLLFLFWRYVFGRRLPGTLVWLIVICVCLIGQWLCFPLREHYAYKEWSPEAFAPFFRYIETVLHL